MEEFVNRVKEFVYRHKQNEKSVFHIVPQDLVEKQEITTDLQVYIDFIKPSCKIEVMKPTDSQNYEIFVPKVRTKELIVK